MEINSVFTGRKGTLSIEVAPGGIRLTYNIKQLSGQRRNFVVFLSHQSSDWVKFGTIRRFNAQIGLSASEMPEVLLSTIPPQFWGELYGIV